MPDLIAQGPRRQQRWRKRVPHEEQFNLGREAGTFTVNWDSHISRQHVDLTWNGSVLIVERRSDVANPVFFGGHQVDRAEIRLGEHFVIGQTTFTVVDEQAGVGGHFDALVTERTFAVQHIRHHRFLDPAARLEIISKLPEQIAESAGDNGIYEQLVRCILEGVPSAETVALCTLENEQVRFLYWDRTGVGSLQVSRRLISKAVQSRETVLHTWTEDQVQENANFTTANQAGWAFATPFQGEATRAWALYVSGARSGDSAEGDLRDELKFAEIVTSTVASFVDVRRLQQRQSALGHFFSQPVINAISDGDPDQALMPREVEVTVLFCDLRGFSLATERSSDDLLGLLHRVSDALGVLTSHILGEGGVIGDFHGDAAMGFWGWPLPQDDAAVRAARAALNIRKAFAEVAKEADHRLSDFRIGVGIASGRAVAGKIGTVDQVKVTAFGPAVNVAARLETMTKQLSTSILIDATTAQQLRQAASDELRTRHLAKVQPYGMERSLDVWELLPPEHDFPLLTDDDIRNYETGLQHFLSGEWQQAWESLHEVTANDRSKDFLISYIASRSRNPPQDWDGVVRLDRK